MALLFMDSFDAYATADLTEKWTASGAVGATVTIGSGNGRHGSHGLRFATGGAANETFYVQKTLAAGDATFCLGFSVVVPAGTMGVSGIALASIRDGSSAQLTLVLNADYTLVVLRGNHGGTVLGTSSSAPLTGGVVAHVEWKGLIHPSAGTVAVRVNGALVAGLTLTSQNTRATATAQWTGVGLGQVDAILSNIISVANIDYDDCYVLDGTGAAPLNDFLGDCRVDALLPTGAGATTGWTPSAGANWQCVDDAAPNDDTDYTSAATTGLTDTFVFPDAPVAGATIYGIQHNLSSKKTDAGTASLAPVIRHSGVDYPGTAIFPGLAYTYALQIAATNPGTGVAWTEAGLNACDFGYTRLS